MGRHRDAAVAVVCLLFVGVGLAVFRPRIPLSVVLVGLFGTLALEAVLSPRRVRTRVRAVWERTVVQVISVGALLVAVASTVALVGPSVLVAVCSGLVTYLLLLAADEYRARRANTPNNS
ncbi:hypothetical protein [Haloferax mucosum]|nr:hypothetical protein [Haloferax mucosum]